MKIRYATHKSFVYCCRECEIVLSPTKCKNQCPKTWVIKGNVNKLFATRCIDCDYEGCNNFIPFRES